MTAAVRLFRSRPDATRLAIVPHLAPGEHRFVDLTSHPGPAQSTLSAHLDCLRACGLVTSRPQRRASMFSLARPELFGWSRADPAAGLVIAETALHEDLRAWRDERCCDASSNQTLCAAKTGLVDDARGCTGGTDSCCSPDAPTTSPLVPSPGPRSGRED